MQAWGWLVVVVYTLAVARVTGLVTADELTGPPRDALQHLLGRRFDSKRGTWIAAPNPRREALAYLVTCQWCASIWVAAAAAPLAYFLGTSPWLLVPALALAMSQVTGMLSDLGRT